MKRSAIQVRPVLRMLGWILLVQAACQVVPAVCCLFYGETRDLLAFLAVGALTALAGGTCRALGGPGEMYQREGILIVSLGWLLASAFGGGGIQAGLVGAAGYDIVADGSDNFATRYLVNDACVLAGKPNAYGSIFRFEGQASVFAAEGGPCYRCLHPEPPPPGLVPSCAEGGVLGVLPGLIGTIQATEAIKLITGIGEPLIGRFVIYDALRMRFRELKLSRDPQCAVCGDHPTIRELKEYEGYCTPATAASTHQNAMDITVKELKERMDRGDAPRLIDIREPHEHAICTIPGAELIPAAQFIQRLGEFEPGTEIVVHCKSGARSGRAVEMMKARGFTNARNLTGGVLAWIDQVDPSQRKY